MGEMARRPLSLDQTALAMQCQAHPPPALLKGIEQFNRREFFECHETLEKLWIAERGPVRYLYQGILQVGVAFYHLGRGNRHGALALLRSGQRYLQPFAPACQGVDVARLLADAAAAERRLLESGATQPQEFEGALIPRVWLAGGTLAVRQEREDEHGEGV